MRDLLGDEIKPAVRLEPFYCMSCASTHSAKCRNCGSRHCGNVGHCSEAYCEACELQAQAQAQAQAKGE